MHRDGFSCRNAQLPSHLLSEPEEVNVASGVVGMGRSGAASRIRRGGRRDAYATLCANFHQLELPSSPGGRKTLDFDQSREWTK
jgi:hypothetical protein